MTETEERQALAALTTARGSSLAALSRMLGRNPTYLQQYLGRASPRRLEERDRRALAGFFGVDDAALGGPERVGPPRVVPRLDVRAAAGSGGVADDDRLLAPLLLDPGLVARLGVPAHALTVLRAQGDSMSPQIEDGDELLVNAADRRADDRPGLFVARVDDALLVKRVSRSGDRVSLVSDNPAYPPRVLPACDVDVLGRVVWLSRCPR